MHIHRSILVLSAIAVFSSASHGFALAVTIDIPEKSLIDAMRAGIACIITNKDGSRMLDRALMSAALLRMGINEPVKEWLDAVTFNGRADRETEVEYVFAVRNYIDYSGDKAYLQVVYPKVVKVLEFTRGQRRENIGRSYCDDLFSLRGFKDGAYLANLMGSKKDAGWMQKEADDLRKSIRDSINKSGFDPASTAVAIAEADELEYMPKELLKNAFDGYFAEFGKGTTSAHEREFEPYEIYSANVYLMTDQRGRGLTILRHFAKKSAGTGGWNYMTETAPGYINAVRTMFVYEDDSKLILGAGLAPEWFDHGIVVKDMPTLYGRICYLLKKEGNTIKYFVYGSAKPPKGVKFILPKELAGCRIEEMKAKQ